MELKILGVDPAPVKGLTIFNGNAFEQVKIKDIKRLFIDKYDTCEQILICWDSPLATPMSSWHNPLYERAVELFFRKFFPDTPKGISTLAYAGCPHWTVSQYVLGYPILNPKLKEYHETNANYKLLLPENTPRDILSGRWVAEVHPALAMWLWLKSKTVESFQYKGTGISKSKSIANSRSLFLSLQSIDEIALVTKIEKEEIISNDHLDAYIAWLLGALWVNQKAECKDSIKFLGSDEGYFLLPDINYDAERLLSVKFKEFYESIMISLRC